MDVIMPQLGETVTEGVVTRWYKKVGDAVKADEMLFDVETDKVSTEIPAPASGVVAEILVQEGATAKVGSRLAVIRESGASSGEVAVAEQTASVAAAAPQTVMTHAGRVAPAAAGNRLSPVVRRLIAEHQLNPADIRGTGRDGRLTRGDVIPHRAARGTQPAVAPAVAPAPQPTLPSGGAPASREQGSRLRDATDRESGAVPSSAGVASVSAVTSPKGAPVPPSDGALPLFIGPPESVKEIAIQYGYFRRSLAAIGQVPAQVQVSARGAWQIRLESGLTLELGRESIQPRLDRFIAVYDRTINPLQRKLDYVD